MFADFVLTLDPVPPLNFSKSLLAYVVILRFVADLTTAVPILVNGVHLLC